MSLPPTSTEDVLHRKSISFFLACFCKFSWASFLAEETFDCVPPSVSSTSSSSSVSFCSPLHSTARWLFDVHPHPECFL
jgi:hypothetical protein